MAEFFVDVGKSGVRLGARDNAGAVVESDRGVSPTAREAPGTAIAVSILSLLQRAGAPAVEGVVIGSTSELSEPERRALFRTLRHELPGATIVLTDDGTLSHVRYVGAPGVLLAVGTGVIAIARDRADRLSRFDGWGPLLGDAGGAVDVGLGALRHAYAAVDAGERTALGEAVEAACGPLGVEAAAALTADRDWPAGVAGLARIVCELADAGDPDASGLLDSAADKLTRTAARATARAGIPEVTLVGRFGRADAMRSRLELRTKEGGMVLRTPDAPGYPPLATLLAGPYRHRMQVDHPEAGR